MTGGTGGFGGSEHTLSQGYRVLVGRHRHRSCRWRGVPCHRGLGQQCVFSDCASAGDCDRSRRPALVIHLAHPVEKGDQPVDIGIAQVLLGHQPTVTLFVIELGWVLQESPQVRSATLLRDLGEVGGVVRTFAEDGVAVDAVVLVPDILAQRDRRRDVLCVCELGKLPVAVDGKAQKDQRGDKRRANREVM